jgi:hypothetical protein
VAALGKKRAVRHVFEKKQIFCCILDQQNKLSLTSYVHEMHSLLLCRGRTTVFLNDARTHEFYISYAPMKTLCERSPFHFPSPFTALVHHREVPAEHFEHLHLVSLRLP